MILDAPWRSNLLEPSSPSLEGEDLGRDLVEARKLGGETPRQLQIETAAPPFVGREPRVAAARPTPLAPGALLPAASRVAADVEDGQERGDEHGSFEDRLIPAHAADSVSGRVCACAGAWRRRRRARVSVNGSG